MRRWDGRSEAVFEAPALVAGLDDVAVVGEPIEERGCHLGVTEDRGPFAEGKVGGDDHRSLLVEPADEMEQELAAGLGERQIAEFVEDDELERLGHTGSFLGLKSLSQNDAHDKTFGPIVQLVNVDDGQLVSVEIQSEVGRIVDVAVDAAHANSLSGRLEPRA